jgi:hypothetical protein
LIFKNLGHTQLWDGEGVGHPLFAFDQVMRSFFTKPGNTAESYDGAKKVRFLGDTHIAKRNTASAD